MTQYWERMSKVWGQMEIGPRMILLALAGAAMVTLLVFFTWLAREDYTLLYSNLNPEDSARVIEVLQKRGVEYRITEGGGGVMVPSRQIGEMRIVLAGEGVGRGGTVGYELFDDQGLGVSEFTQNLNFQRALEGELARSIVTIRGVDKARVHLVIPKPTLFKEERREPSASVVLSLGSTGSLGAGQVQAIQRMVGSAVEGLVPDQVTVLDAFGNLISREAGDDMVGMSSAQHDIKRQVESYLGQKAQRTLEDVLGGGAALVRVNAELDFERVERTREVVDPENAAILSEVRSQDSNEATGSVTESSTVNYEFNRMVESIIGDVGSVKNLTVAVLLDGKYSEGKDGAAVYEPLNAQEIEGYRKVVENIVGYDSERGDKIEILNVRFKHTTEMISDGGMFGMPMTFNLPGIINKVLFFGVLAFMLLAFRKMGVKMAENMGRVSTKVSSAGSSGIGEIIPSNKQRQELEKTNWEDMISEDAHKEIHMEEQAKALALEKPEDIAQLLRTWMVMEDAN